MALLGGVLVITLVRLSLIGKGTMAFVDEQRYVTAMLGLRALGEGHVQESLQAINSMGARPGDGLWRAIPGLGQAALLLLFKLNPNSPPSLQVPQAFNVLIMSLNALLLYRIYRRFFSANIALVGIALYSGLVNTNVYLRHILPYDHSLFFFLLAINYLLAPAHARTTRRHWWAGVLAGVSYAVYPGYFLGPLVLLGLALALSLAPGGHEGKSQTERLKPVASLLAGLLAVLASFELLARLSDTSYLASSRYIATTVTQGSFDEGFSFIATYFWEVEGWFGAMLLALFVVGLFLSAKTTWLLLVRRDYKSEAQLPLLALLSLAFLGWLGYAVTVQLAHKLVFYGRIIHFFVPFIVMGSLVVLQRVAQEPILNVWLLALGILGLWRFSTFALAYRTIEYPPDVVYAHGIHDARQIAGIETTGCTQNLVYYRVFGPPIRDQRTNDNPRYRLINFAYLLPIACNQPRPDAGDVVAAVPYFMRYRPYQFEGHNPDERTLLQNQSFDFRIIRTQ
ncbi:hypothetical protein BEN47_17730 [Hymenobacter lapidarius]|uniref:Glycosyltransferase RgtA/B/C/D-like domain-containing protein n=1 Tax=Hymenobacter lapidarius TaxID=1908237 RepID=A0A1G1SX22_9BACT|nr:hypothetical protein BEN47_17730 [Hymenobacter lapidarius]